MDAEGAKCGLLRAAQLASELGFKFEYSNCAPRFSLRIFPPKSFLQLPHPPSVLAGITARDRQRLADLEGVGPGCDFHS